MAEAAKIEFQRVAALAEVFFVLALGNIAGLALFEAIAPAAVVAGEAEGVAAGLYAGLRIFLRIGLVAGFGLLLLWLRRGLTPRDAGLTRAGKPLSQLIGIGVLLGAFSSFLVGFVFALDSVLPLGAGLQSWDSVRAARLDTAFYVDMLATSVIIPPLVEEVMARGYTRLRLVESYGPMSGVILAGLVFAFSHGKFLSYEPVLALSMAGLAISSIAWTYIVHKTGSLIPAMVAHALTNGIATVMLFTLWGPLAAVGLVLVWKWRGIRGAIRQFDADWRVGAGGRSLVFGIVVLAAIFVALLISISVVGRVSALLALGTAGFALTAYNIHREMRQG